MYDFISIFTLILNYISLIFDKIKDQFNLLA